MSVFKKILNWFKTSNRWKHLLGGVVVGGGSNTVYCAAYSGIGIASALELKDYLYGNKWDWIDWILTIIGVSIGYLLRIAIIAMI